MKEQLKNGSVSEEDPVEKAMMRFQRKRGTYHVITMETRLEELEGFFGGLEGDGNGGRDFAVVTDQARKFVLGVATKEDLREFVRRRP